MSIREADRTYPLIVLATVLLIIAGPVLAITLLVSIITINLERRRAPALVIAEGASTDIWEYGDLCSRWNRGRRISDDLANALIDLGHRAAKRRRSARSAAGVKGLQHP